MGFGAEARGKRGAKQGPRQVASWERAEPGLPPPPTEFPGAPTYPYAPEELRGEGVEQALPRPPLAVTLLSGRKP